LKRTKKKPRVGRGSEKKTGIGEGTQPGKASGGKQNKKRGDFGTTIGFGQKIWDGSD